MRILDLGQFRFGRLQIRRRLFKTGGHFGLTFRQFLYFPFQLLLQRLRFRQFRLFRRRCSARSFELATHIGQHSPRCRTRRGRRFLDALVFQFLFLCQRDGLAVISTQFL